MARVKGIQAHKLFKLGKAPAKKDTRTLQFATLLRAAAPELPTASDFDTLKGSDYARRAVSSGQERGIHNPRIRGEDRMAKAKGIQAHKLFKLGTAPAKKDKRTLQFATLLRAAAPALPTAYDFDTTHAGIPTPMFANDVHGDCVIAGRAHQTLRFEDIEQGSVLMITDKEVLKEYFKETGGPDTGLVVLDSLNRWRHTGWKVGKHTYRIHAFAEVNFRNHDEVRQAIFADVGVGLGVQLPNAAKGQIQTGQPWDVTTGPDATPGSWGGHYIYVPGYTPSGPVCVTWGRKQQMTWAWLDKYCDEAYAIFDAKNRFKKALIDQAKIAAFLRTLTQ